MTHEWAKALVATVILALLALTGLRIGEWRTEAVPQENISDLSDQLFTTYLFPFEVLSVLLLGALMAALYVGQKVKREEENR